MSFCTFVISEIAPPNAAFGARLNETVIAGNCPWCVIESASVVVSKCEKALNGTALLVVELVAPADVAPLLELDVTVLDVSAFAGGVSVFADGVNNADPVSAFEPADVEPLPEEEEAAAPLWPADEFDSR
jgi:hypothetical protein